MNDTSLCNGVNCKIKNYCKRYNLGIKLPKDKNNVYLWWVEPRYDSDKKECINYIKDN
jgi:hypothetical protein